MLPTSFGMTANSLSKSMEVSTLSANRHTTPGEVRGSKRKAIGFCVSGTLTF
jgi:hypothetical protein